jgi:hypothetical protein
VLIDEESWFKKHFEEWKGRVYITVDPAKPEDDSTVTVRQRLANALEQLGMAEPVSLLTDEARVALERINAKHAAQKEQDRLWSLVCLAAESSRYGG